MLLSHSRLRLSLTPVVFVLGSLAASAQSTKVVELSRFSYPLDVSVGIAAMPDGRVFGFGYGASGFGGIFEAIPNGVGGYTNVQVAAFSDTGELPQSYCRNSICADSIAPGTDGNLYFAGRWISRFDPAAGTVTHLYDFGTANPDDQSNSLSLGNDGHTLFGTRLDGRVYSFDLTTSTYRELTNVVNVNSAVQMDNGTLMVSYLDIFYPLAGFTQVDVVTGAWVKELGITPGYASIPTRGDDGKIYLFANNTFNHALWRIDSGCFCADAAWGLPKAFPAPSIVTGAKNGFVYYNAQGGIRRMRLTTKVSEPVTTLRPDSRMTMTPDGRLMYFIDQYPAGGYWRAIDTTTLVPGVESSVIVAQGVDNDGFEGVPTDIIEAPNGKLYGVGNYSLTPNAKIYEIDPVTRTKTVVATFAHQDFPDFNVGGVEFKPMVVGPDGRLYGVYNLYGSHLFRFDPATNAAEILKEWDIAAEGGRPRGLARGSDGYLYGVLGYAGDALGYGAGGIFRVDTATGDVTTLLATSGFQPSGNLVEAAPGIWYTVTSASDYPYCSNVVRFDQSTAALTTVKRLEYTDGCDPELAVATNGMLIGAAAWAGPNPSDPNQYSVGDIFTLDPANGALTILSSYSTDGAMASPHHPFIGADGYAYATLQTITVGGSTSLVRIDPLTNAVGVVTTTPGVNYTKGPSGRVYAGGTTLVGIGILDAIPVAPASGPFGGTTSVSATLKAIGIPLPGRTITFKLNGHPIGSASTNASGVATINNVSLAGITIGSYPAAIIASFAGDDAFPSSAGAGTLTVIDMPTPGLMFGDGYIRDDDMRYDFGFAVYEKPNGTDRGRFVLTVIDTDKPKHGKKKPKPRNDRFVSTSYTNVVFSDDPTIRPGRRPRPQVDTVVFSGRGTWNGVSGYRFEAFAQDCGEPGRRRESLRVVIYDSANHVVVSFDDELAGGNVQSVRLRH